MATSLPITMDVEYLAAQQQLEQVQDLLKVQKAAQQITSILDLDQLIESIVNDVASSFGCLETNIYLHDEDRQDLVIAGSKGCSVHGKGHRMKVGKEGLVGHVAASGQMRYAPDVNVDPYYAACEENVRSEVAIPLLVGSKLVGVFTASHPELDAFPEDQLQILQALCAHIAVAVQNARVFQRERLLKAQMDRDAQEARAIQQNLFPKSSPYVPGFVISGFCVPAGAVGGDWYDFIALDDGRWGIVLADVSGKGMAAALLMSATRGMVRSLAEACCSPSEVLMRLNKLMAEDFPSGRFVTMVYAVFDPRNRKLTFANAGHLPPLLVSGDSAQFVATECGLPLGLCLGTRHFSETTITLPQGSRLLFYSDGITEAANLRDEEYGSERLRAHMSKTSATADSLLAEVQSFSDGAGLRDDATVVMITS
ncbi:MAG TPA: GAF domain-containing SpoIIE family protein phosphatase [Terriglobales bacterium]|nr:GAF domain-containing SpoIIE family protein phosphatase [Terriglobales bacterium]